MAKTISAIITHEEPRHLDDLLTISILKSKFPNTKIITVNPQNVPEEYLSDPTFIVADVGGQYSEELNNFDHHQDPNLPCSLHLVMKKFMTEFYERHKNSLTMKAIDFIDRYGFKKAAEILNLVPDEAAEACRKTILQINLNKYYYTVYLAFLNTLELANDDFNLFLKVFYIKLDKAGVLEEAKEKIRKEEEEFNRKLSSSEITLLSNGLRVLVSRESLAPNHYKAFKATDADIIVEPNSMNNAQTSIIRNSSSPKAENIDLSKVFRYYPKIFIHNSGFIAVIDTKIENFNIKTLLETFENNSVYDTQTVALTVTPW